MVGDNITIRCEATDASTIVQFEYLVDGAAIGDTLSSCDFPWDTRTVANGTHSLVVRATDEAGNTGQSSAVTVVVDNDPVSVLIVAVCIEDAPYQDASGEPWDEDGDPDWSITLIDSAGHVLIDSGNPVADLPQAALPYCWTYQGVEVPSLGSNYTLTLLEDDNGSRTSAGSYGPRFGFSFYGFEDLGWPDSVTLSAGGDLTFRLDLNWLYP